MGWLSRIFGSQRDEADLPLHPGEHVMHRVRATLARYTLTREGKMTRASFTLSKRIRFMPGAFSVAEPEMSRRPVAIANGLLCVTDQRLVFLGDKLNAELP